MTRFRPCIDLHDGKVMQIVGGSLREDGAQPETSFVASHCTEYYAEKYRQEDLTGGRVIRLGT